MNSLLKLVLIVSPLLLPAPAVAKFGGRLRSQSWQGTSRPAAVRPLAEYREAGSGVALSDGESRLLAGINRLRRARGKTPIAADPVLMRVCRERVNNLFGGDPHTSGRYGGAERHAARYASWADINDVVAAGNWSDGSRASPESSVEAWRNSDGHLRCILGQHNVNDRWVNEGYDRVGVARGRQFDVAVFGILGD